MKRTLIDFIKEREPFTAELMAMTFHVQYDQDRCELMGVYGMADIASGTVILNPELDDNVLLDTFAHEVIEVASNRMEWKMPHRLITQLGLFVGAMLGKETTTNRAKPTIAKNRKKGKK